MDDDGLPDFLATQPQVSEPGTTKVSSRPPVEKPTTDQRTLTRRARDRAQHERMMKEKADRELKESIVLGLAASGAGFRAIAQEVGCTEQWARKLYKRAMGRPGDRDVVEFKAMQLDRLNRLLFATWSDSMDNDDKSVRNSLRLIQEMNRLEPGAYPRIGVDVSGTLETRDASVERVASALERLHAQRQRQAVLAPESAAVDNVDPKPHVRAGGRAAFPPPDEFVDDLAE